jgi:L,D-transpeptidase YbiS
MTDPWRTHDVPSGLSGSLPRPPTSPSSVAPAAPRPRRRPLLAPLRLLGRAALATLRRPALRWIPVALVLAGVGLLLALGTGYQYGRWDGSGAAPVALPPEASVLKKLVGQLQTERQQSLAALRKHVPRGLYVVIDQTHNRFYLKRDETVELEAVCSAGSGYVLKEGAGDRKWVFDTPRGLFSIHNRISDPAWRKPDWAFIEEGKPIPTNPADRVEYGTMGEYAFDLGHSYFIHGTLYERLLGRSVTHGCIRLGREDLRTVARSVTIGTPVYIY